MITLEERFNSLKGRVKILERLFLDEVLKNDELSKQLQEKKKLDSKSARDIRQRVQVDKNIPIPKDKGKITPEYNELLLSLKKVGDSILISLEDSVKISRVMTSFHQCTDLRFSFRKVSKSKARVWRTN